MINPELYACRSQEDFNRIFSGLERFRDRGHERIELSVKDGIPVASTGAKACWCTRVVKWILRFFCCAEHPAQKTARLIVTFLATNSKFILQTDEHQKILNNILTIKKANSEIGRLARL